MSVQGDKSSDESAGVHTWLILSKARRVLEAFAQKSIESLKICPTDFSVLELLLHKGPLPVNIIGKRVFITSGSMTTAIDRLEALKLVERRDDPSDRRVRVVGLTEHGGALIREKFGEHKKHMDLAFSTLDKGEIEDLQRLLRKLGKGAETVLHSPAFSD